jgi:gliding motility-associated-like protein
MRRLIYLLALWAPIASAQCDLSITSWDASTGDIVIEAINSENCGCNEFTSEDTTCGDSSNPYTTNNEVVNHIVLGLHSPGLDYTWGCTTAINHPGWTFKVATLYGNQVLESGDTWNANVYSYGSFTNDCWAEMLANDTLCMELAIWQINLSQTATTDIGGWAVNPNIASQTQNYPDVNLIDNSVVTCAEAACDTVYVDVIEYISDTISVYVCADTVTLIEYVDVEWITIDTLYITEVDTLIEYVQLPPDTVHEYSTDTIILTETEYVDVIIDNYVYITDTITEFVAVTTYIDCETGEQCGELSPCDETSIYAPNVVTPNDDGWNDTWQIIADGACWDQWEVRVYNRWGGLVWISASSNDEWEANVATGVYVYTITAHSSTSASVFEFNGTLTVLY